MNLDFIGDIHGCADELEQLFERLGYTKKNDRFVHPENRYPVFIGDLTDRGPRSVDVMEYVYYMVKESLAYYVPGNHCDKLYRYLIGRNVVISNGLETTVAELKDLNRHHYEKVKDHFIELYEKAPLYKTFSEDKVIAAHAGIKKSLIGQKSKKVKTFVLYGDITGEKNPDGSPVRRDWAKHYDGDHLIIYGHTPVSHPRAVNHTINIDTGCVFGGQLTAYRFPEGTYESVDSSMPYVEEKFRSFDDKEH